MMNVMVCLTKHNMMLPLRGEFCESPQIPWTLPMAGRLSPFQGVNGWCAPKGQPSDNTVCNASTKLPDADNNSGMCAPKGQLSGSPTASPWATVTPRATITPSATPWAMVTATPVSATNGKCKTAPKGHKQKGYGTIAL